jgi:hypothetical protein
MVRPNPYAVVECPTYGQAYDPQLFICSFDLPSEFVTSGTLKECMRYIVSSDDPTAFVIVRLNGQETFDADDIVWKPFDRECEEWIRHYFRDRSSRVS